MSLTSQRRLFRFRGPSSSESYNRMAEERFYDLLSLAEREGTTRARLDEAVEIRSFETDVLASWLSTLQEAAQGDETAVVTFGPSTLGLGYVEPSGDPASKIYLGGQSNPLLPSSLSDPDAIRTYESTSQVIDPLVADALQPVEMDWLGALHPSRQRWSFRKSELAGESLFFSIHLKLPRAVVNHFRVNAFRLDPLIPGSMKLHGIWYRQADQEWILLPTIPTDAMGDVEPLERLVPTYIFSPVLDMSEVFFAFEQTYKAVDGVFPYGFRHIGVEYWPYDASHDYSSGDPYGLDLECLAPEGKYFDEIQSVEPIWHPWSLSDPGLLKEIKVLVDGEEKDPGNVIGASVNRVILRARIYTNQGGTPALKGFRVGYTLL